MKRNMYALLVLVGYVTIADAVAILVTEKILRWDLLLSIFLIASVTAYAGVIKILWIKKNVSDPTGR